MDLPLVPLQASRVIDSVLETVSGDLRQHGVQVRSDPAPSDVQVSANEDRMRQALINLLANAMKYNTAQCPEIAIRTHTGPRWFDIDVIDNGGGLTRDEVGSVFEKFKRGRRGEHNSGTGLGLTISRAIMRNMGGDLTVEFAADGTSFFRMRLGVASTPATQGEVMR